MPVPSQRQLDSARKILSTYEEQGVYDILRLPFLMPNQGNTPPASDDEVKDGKSKKDSKTGYAKAGLPGIGAKMKEKVKELAEARMPWDAPAALSCRVTCHPSG